MKTLTTNHTTIFIGGDPVQMAQAYKEMLESYEKHHYDVCKSYEKRIEIIKDTLEMTKNTAKQWEQTAGYYRSLLFKNDIDFVGSDK